MTRLRLLDIRDSSKIFSRVFPVHRLLEVLRDGKLTLVPPREWDDPFENFLLRSRVRLPFGTWASFRWLHDSYYGQCWTLLSESDALWRIYSPHRQGVLVRTTLASLRPRLVARRYAPDADALFLGKVRYMPAADIRELFSNKRWRSSVFDAGSTPQAKTLFIKRPEFSHKQEVRLVAFREPSNAQQALPVLHVAIRPNTAFIEMVLDPRMSRPTARRVTAAIRAAGYKGPVAQSSLYRPPSLEFRVEV